MKRVIIVFIMLIPFIFVQLEAEAAKPKPTYTVSPDSKTYKNNMMKNSTYNKYTKHYYLLRSYLEQLEKSGGGTLVLKKGTYTITNVLYVPSNVTIQMQNGVVIKKGMTTGTNKFPATKSIFQFIRPSLAAKTGVYGGYNGEKNISIIGEGTATIDLANVKEAIGIVAGHNQNIVIDNIQFKNMNTGHFIEIDATKNIQVKNSEFLHSVASPSKNKEAINLDTPDRTTKGWGHPWSKYDQTPNHTVMIEKNKFYNLDRAIGTHKYSHRKYHHAVTIRNNTIEKTRTYAIQVLNWSNAVIEKNKVKDAANGTYRLILVSGANNPTIRNNTFEKASRAVQFVPWKNSGAGSQYAITYNTLNTKNKKQLETNSVKNVTDPMIRINSIYDVYEKGFEKISTKTIK